MSIYNGYDLGGTFMLVQKCSPSGVKTLREENVGVPHLGGTKFPPHPHYIYNLENELENENSFECRTITSQTF
jgi:hypothetical protein